MEQKDAWDSLYRSQSRQWRGVSDITFPFGEGERILDAGCGNGKTSAALIDMGCVVTGVDFSREAVEFCSKTYGMDAVCCSVTSLPFPDGSFDGAVMVHILEHLTPEETADTVDEMHRVLKDGALLFVRSFSINDMRSTGDMETVRGNGIRYRYFTENDMEYLFRGFEKVSVELVEKRTKFGDVRSRVEAIFKK